MVCLGAVMALSAIGVGAAQAARPVQPQFIKATKAGACCETIKSGVTIEDSSGRSRLWSPTAGILIRCEKDFSSGTIGPKGLDNGEVTYKECKVFKPEENVTTKQWEEGPEIGGCEVEGGEIKTKHIKSHLVWNKGKNEVLVLYTPEVGTEFVPINIVPAGCAVHGSFAITGGVLAQPTRINSESVMTVQTFETNNENSKVSQRYTEWEVEQEGGVKESGTTELKLGAKASALESVEQVELEKQNGLKRGPFGIHE